MVQGQAFVTSAGAYTLEYSNQRAACQANGSAYGKDGGRFLLLYHAIEQGDAAAWVERGPGTLTTRAGLMSTSR